MDKAELEALLARIDVWLLVFGIVVVVGVAGESFFGIRHWWNSRKLQAIQQSENEAQRTELARLAEQTAQANARAAEATRIAEAEKLARIKIEERLAARRISPKEFSAILAVEVDKLFDIEAEPFSDDVIRTLTDSGWVVHVSGAGMRAPAIFGLQCVVNDSLPAGKALGAAFKSLPTANVKSDHSLPVVARIVVGLKPPP